MVRYAIVCSNGNYSYFEYPRGAFHSSAYSDVGCLKCHARGRTKAKYVDSLPDGTYEQFMENY